MKQDEDFHEYAKRIINDHRQSRIRHEVHGRGWGNWYIWQVRRIMEDLDLPKDHQERFNMFIKEFAPAVQPGEHHLHAFYDKKRGEVYWKLTQRSTVCKVPGRCVKVVVGRQGELYRH